MASAMDPGVQRVSNNKPERGDINLLIIGKTGHGKSSTANSIFGRTEFYAASTEESVTKECQSGTVTIDGRKITVVDVPGVCDTDLDDGDSLHLAIQSITEAITSCPNGFHALLVVLKYGMRMTNEEIMAIKILKGIFGTNIIQTHCVCVITHGDNFRTDDDVKVTFEEWCTSQIESLRDIFEECNYRCVLFDNRSKDSAVLKLQLNQLLSAVDIIETCYTNDLFFYAEEDRKRIIRKLELPKNRNEIMDKLRQLEYELNKIPQVEGEKRKELIIELKTTTEDLKNKMGEVDDCGGIADLFHMIDNFSHRLLGIEEKDFAEEEFEEERQTFAHEKKRYEDKLNLIEKTIKENTKKRIHDEISKASDHIEELRIADSKLKTEEEKNTKLADENTELLRMQEELIKDRDTHDKEMKIYQDKLESKSIELARKKAELEEDKKNGLELKAENQDLMQTRQKLENETRTLENERKELGNKLSESKKNRKETERQLEASRNELVIQKMKLENEAENRKRAVELVQQKADSTLEHTSLLNEMKLQEKEYKHQMDLMDANRVAEREKQEAASKLEVNKNEWKHEMDLKAKSHEIEKNKIIHKYELLRREEKRPWFGKF